MRTANTSEKADRAAVQRFAAFYCKELSIEFDPPKHPEEDAMTHAAARIDSIYSHTKRDLHIEHTSVDLIVSGAKNKRELDPGFLILQEQLKKIECPSGRGVTVYLPLEYARNRPKLKKATPSLLEKITEYIQYTHPSEWEKYPRIPDKLIIDDMTFEVRPDVLRTSNIQLHWSASNANFLEREELAERLCVNIPPKIRKIDCSLKQSKVCADGILIVETFDIAAQSFHSLCGVFAKILLPLETSLSEIWGMHGTSNPTLIWDYRQDKGRRTCVYSEDPRFRTCAQIEEERMRNWREGRLKDFT